MPSTWALPLAALIALTSPVVFRASVPYPTCYLPIMPILSPISGTNMIVRQTFSLAGGRQQRAFATCNWWQDDILTTFAWWQCPPLLRYQLLSALLSPRRDCSPPWPQFTYRYYLYHDPCLYITGHTICNTDTCDSKNRRCIFCCLP